jgi:hypothetical protein
VRSTKARRKKLKQFSITLTKPISLNSVSNSTNKLHFHCQKVNYLSKLQKLSEREKRLLNYMLIKRVELLFIQIFLRLIYNVPALGLVRVCRPVSLSPVDNET